jgi:hypothetical protein
MHVSPVLRRGACVSSAKGAGLRAVRRVFRTGSKIYYTAFIRPPTKSFCPYNLIPRSDRCCSCVPSTSKTSRPILAVFARPRQAAVAGNLSTKKNYYFKSTPAKHLLVEKDEGALHGIIPSLYANNDTSRFDSSRRLIGTQDERLSHVGDPPPS